MIACTYFFCLLAAYYLVRPVRDAMGIESGVNTLKWLYVGSMSTMLIASLVFSAITSAGGQRGLDKRATVGIEGDVRGSCHNVCSWSCGVPGRRGPLWF